MRLLKFIFLLTVLLSVTYNNLLSQTPLSSIGCPAIDKRSNGNGQAASAAGDFTPTYAQNNPVAPNITGTIYEDVPYNPQSKTGNFNFRWPATVNIVNLPCITRVWITPVGSETAVLSAIKFGPPPPIYTSGNFKYANYCFYVQNMANAGRVTIEFTDPQTNSPVFWCTFDLGTGASAPQPTNFSCGPTVSTVPLSQTFCGDGSVTFSAAITGQTSFNWQQSSNGSDWTNISAGGDFTTLNATTLTISNRSTYTSKYFRIQAINSCGTTYSSSALLTVNPLPTAVFTNSSSLCGLGVSRSLGVDFTGTGPWSFTYTVNGGSPTTVSNVTADPYYFTVTPAVATTYLVTSVSDSKCSNSSLTGNTSVAVNANPTISYTSTPSVCEGSSSFGLVYSSTSGAPDKISFTTGTRVLSGFSAVSNANLTSTPQSVTIPSNGAAGDYDFNMTVTNSSTGCISASYPVVLTIKPKPVMTASASSANICSGASSTLTATGASSYSWVSSPAGFTSSSSSPSVSPTASTSYTVTGTGANGCVNTASTSINVFSVSSPTISASSTTICGGQQAVLTGSGGSTYSWSGPSFSATGSTVSVAPLSTSTYTVTATNSDGCTSTASQTITVSGGPTITGLSPVTICQGASTTLTAGGATTYAWSTGATTAGITVSPTSTTTYTVVGSSGGCSSTATVIVTVTTTPVVTAPSSQILYCSTDLTGNSTLSFSFSSSPTSVTCKWYSASTSAYTDTVEINTTSLSGNQYMRSETNISSVTSSTLTSKSPGNNNQFFRLHVFSGSCSFKYDTQLINATGTPAMTVSSNQTICSGATPTALTSNVVANVGTGTMGFSYKWQSSTDNITYSDISGATSTSYSPGALTVDTWYRFVVTTTTKCPGTWNSTAVKITIATAVANNTLSTTNSCAAGTSITGSTPTGGSGTYTYSWESSTTSSSAGFSTVTGVTTQSYTPPIPSQTTWYRRLVTSGSCSNSTSAAIALYPPLTDVQISNGQTLCSGASITALSVSPSGGETSASYSYSWEKSTTSSSSGFSSLGVSTSNYTPTTSAGNTEYFRVVVTKGACSATSNAATIVVRANPTITVSPSSETVCSGASATLTASGGVSYTWSPATDLSATTGAALVTSPTASRTYTTTGTDANGCTNTATATITYGASPSTPTLSSGSGTICNNSSQNLTSLITSGGTNNWYTVPVVNASYIVNSPTTVSTTGTYYVFALSGSCYSNSYATYTLTVNDVTAPIPTDLSVEVCSPNTVDLTSLQPVATTGTEFKWHTVSSSPAGGNLVGTPSSASAGSYYLYAYSTAGACYGSASSGVTVTQNSLPTVSLSPSSESVCEPNTINLTTKVSAPDGGYTYNWYTTSTNPPSVANLVSDPTSIVASGTFYVFALNNSTGCLSSSPSSFTSTVNADPSLSLTSPNVGCAATSTSLNVSVTNGVSSPTYQWKIYNQSNGNWDDLSDVGVYSGATSTTLSISSNTGLDGAAYYCAVSASGCSANSSVGVIGVSQPNVPTATITHPTCTVSTGTVQVTSYPQDLEFSLSAPTGYQSSTTFSSVASNTYTLTAKDLLNCTNSASVTVDPQPAIPLPPTTAVGSACVYDLPAGTAANNIGNGFSSPVFKWYTASSGDTTVANYQQRSTATSFQYKILITTTHHVAIVHPTSGCESSRTSLTNTVIDPLGNYNPSVNDYVWKGGASADIDDWKTSTNWYQFDGTKYITVVTAPSTNDNVFIPPTGTCIPAQPRVQNENTQQFINLTIKPGGTLTIDGNGVVNVSGNWTNDGTFVCGEGTVNFLTSGNHFIQGANPTTFYNLVLNKPLNGLNKSVLKLSTQAYITGQLTLTAGLFDISTFDINMGGRNINGGSAATYVQTTSTGRLQRDVAGSEKLFPVGRSSYNPATLTNAGTSDKYSIRVIDKLTNIGTNADLSDAQSDSSVVKRTWMIDENEVGNSDVTLRLDWNGNEHNGVFDDQQPYIAHYNSSQSKWENKGWTNRTFTSGNGFVQTTGITDFSPFGISSPEGGVALPVEFLYLNSICNENDEIELNWATASEFNSSNFIIEKSIDGIQWNSIGEVQSAGNSISTSNYSFIDVSRQARSLAYYRLIQYDIDGKSEIFGPILSNCEAKIPFDVLITPNPNDGKFILNIETLQSQEIEIRIFHMEGKEVANKTFTGSKGRSMHYIDLDGVASGIYTLHIYHKKGVLIRKIVIN